MPDGSNTEIGDTSPETALPAAIKSYVDQLVEFPKPGTPEAEKYRQLDLSVHMSLTPLSDEARNEYRSAWEKKYEGHLKEYLPMVVTEALRPDISVQDLPQLTDGAIQTENESSVRNHLQELIRNGNVVALKLAALLVEGDIKRQLKDLSGQLANASFTDSIPLVDRRSALFDRWSDAIKAREALNGKFRSYQYSDLDQAPSISEATSSVRIPGRE